jgi:hypothetical protein
MTVTSNKPHIGSELLIEINQLLCRILPSSGLLHGVSWFKIDVSGLPIGLISKDQTVQEIFTWKMRLIGSPETSVLYQLTPRNNPENRRIQLNRGGSLRSTYVHLTSISINVRVPNPRRFDASNPSSSSSGRISDSVNIFFLDDGSLEAPKRVGFTTN